MIKSNYAVHDCETGGLDANKNPITQYAVIILEPKKLKEVDRWETFVQPYNDLVIEQAALDKTMVTMSDIKNGLKIEEFVKSVTAFWESHRAKTKTREMGSLVSVGHNIPFDHRMLEYALNFKNKKFWEYFRDGFVDTQVLAKMTWGLLGNEKINLGASCDLAKIKLTDAHGAMNDVEANADLFRYFVKKLRSAKGTTATEEVKKRAKGEKFFKFACANKG